jgi:hypothetical protein
MEPEPTYETNGTGKTVERATAIVEGAAPTKQKRLQTGGRSLARSFFQRWYKLTLAHALECPPYGVDWRKSEAFLQSVWRQDPYWAGVVRQVAAIDANRGWELVGGRNQVNRFKPVMHRHIVAPDIIGHHEGMEAGSVAFHTSNIGCIKELARDGEGGPIRGFWHVPPLNARLTGEIETPLEVDGIKWLGDDYLRVTTMADVTGTNPGYGFCSTHAMLEMMKIMVAVVAYKQEKLAARLPQGFLLGSGISEQQFDDAMNARTGSLDGMNREAFGGLAVLISEGQIDLKLVGLSQLPDNFNEEDFVTMYMNLAALTVGYDPAEFWPVRTSGLARGSEEARAQKQKASGKGEKTFILRYFERLREVFPKTLDILPDERDDSGELVIAEIAKAKKDVIMGLYAEGMGIVSRDEARSLAAEQDLLPRDWTLIEEEAVATDTEQARMARWRDVARANDRVQLAARTFSNEPIVMYRYPSNKTVVLYDSGTALLRPHLWPVTRQVKSKRRAVLYEHPAGFTITDDDVAAAFEQAEEWADGGLVSPDLPGVLEAETEE